MHKFRVGQYVILDPKLIDRVDTQRGVVTKVETVYGREKVTVFWEKAGHNDGGSWNSSRLLLV